MKAKQSLQHKFANFKPSCSTDGRGMWTRAKRLVKVEDIITGNVEIDEDFCIVKFHVYFTPRSWSVRKYGLIYLDHRWIKEFRAALVKIGFSKKAAEEVYYTEQGDQGQEYVSLEAGQVFLRELVSK